MSKTVILSLKLENALTSSEAGVLLTALLSYSAVSTGFQFTQRKRLQPGALGVFVCFGEVLFFFIQFFESWINFAFVSGIKVTPESLFSGPMALLASALIRSCLSQAHLVRKLLCDTEWMESFPNLLWKVSKGMCHLTFTGQSGMSELKKLTERDTTSILFRRGERNVRA